MMKLLKVLLIQTNVKHIPTLMLENKNKIQIVRLRTYIL